MPLCRRRFASAAEAALRRGLLALLLAVGVTGRPATATAAPLHPQDGPHCEIVIEIRPDGVRVRLSPNLAFLDRILEWPREDPDAIAPSEVWHLEQLLASFFRERHPVEIDGSLVEPRLGPIEVATPDLQLIGLFPKSGVRGLQKVQFTLAYPSAAPPEQVALLWETYPPDFLSLLDPPPSMILGAELYAPGERRLIEFREQEPLYVWHAPATQESAASVALPQAPPPPAPLRVPIAAIGLCLAGALSAALALQRLGYRRGGAAALAVLAGTAVATTLVGDAWSVSIQRRPASLPSEAEAGAIFRALHRDLYRAFDAIDEEAIYDALETTVDAALLPRLFRSIRRGLILEDEGGVMTRVVSATPLAIEVESIGLVEPPRRADRPIGEVPEEAARLVGFVVRCRWQVEGAVFHWGHGHRRVNEYEGRWLVLATSRGWRIAADELLSQRRVDEEPSPAIVPAAELEPDGEIFEL